MHCRQPRTYSQPTIISYLHHMYSYGHSVMEHTAPPRSTARRVPISSKHTRALPSPPLHCRQHPDIAITGIPSAAGGRHQTTARPLVPRWCSWPACAPGSHRHKPQTSSLSQPAHHTTAGGAAVYWAGAASTWSQSDQNLAFIRSKYWQRLSCFWRTWTSTSGAVAHSACASTEKAAASKTVGSAPSR